LLECQQYGKNRREKDITNEKHWKATSRQAEKSIGTIVTSSHWGPLLEKQTFPRALVPTFRAQGIFFNHKHASQVHIDAGTT